MKGESRSSLAREKGFWPGVQRAFLRAKLETKLVISVVIVAVAGLLAMLVALSAIILPQFEALEEQSAARNVERTAAALDEFSRRVETTVKDYGAWDESYDYIVNPTREFESDTFSMLALTNLDVSGMAYVTFDGTVVYSRWYDLIAQVEVQTRARDFERLLTSPALLKAAQMAESQRFYARVGDRLTAVSTARVIKTDGTGTPRGFVVMARELNSPQLKDLLKLPASLGFAGEPVKGGQMDANRYRLLSVDVDGLNGKPVAHVDFTMPRDLTAMGLRTLFVTMLASTVVLILALGVLNKLIKTMAVSPLRRIERHMQAITSSGDLVPFGDRDRGDEIGSLVRNFNQMLGQLKDLRERVEIQSFKLGKTEAAIGLMHNVRNGLNPLNIILSQVTSSAPPVDQSLIRRAIDELSDCSTDSQRRQKLAGFLEANLSAQAAGAEVMRSELLAARTHLARVVDLIGDQQAAAHERVETERCAVRSVIEQNAALARYSSIGNVRFVVSGDDPEVQANRLLLSQVFGNLFGNAVDSIQAARRKQGVVEVSFTSIDFRGGAGWEVRVRDNGEGFDPAQRKQLFEHGFSTRKHKSGGLGLHWCANAIGMMDGELSLESEGKGLGATAVVRLPAAANASHLPDAEDRAEQAPDPDRISEFQDREIQNRR